MKRYTTLTRCALLTAVALIISLLENFIPIPYRGSNLASPTPYRSIFSCIIGRPRPLPC